MPTFLRPDLGLFLPRLTLAVIFCYHGWPKLKKPRPMAEGMHLPTWFVWLLGVGEVAGSISMIVGVYEQLAGLLLALIMLGALGFKIFKWHAPFKNGWEFDLLLFAGALTIGLVGGGTIGLN